MEIGIFALVLRKNTLPTLIPASKGGISNGQHFVGPLNGNLETWSAFAEKALQFLLRVIQKDKTSFARSMEIGRGAHVSRKGIRASPPRAPRHFRRGRTQRDTTLLLLEMEIGIIALFLRKRPYRHPTVSKQNANGMSVVSLSEKRRNLQACAKKDLKAPPPVS